MIEVEFYIFEDITTALKTKQNKSLIQ